MCPSSQWDLEVKLTKPFHYSPTAPLFRHTAHAGWGFVYTVSYCISTDKMNHVVIHTFQWRFVWCDVMWVIHVVRWRCVRVHRLRSRSGFSCFHTGVILEAKVCQPCFAELADLCHIRILDSVSSFVCLPFGSEVQSSTVSLQFLGGLNLSVMLEVLSDHSDD